MGSLGQLGKLCERVQTRLTTEFIAQYQERGASGVLEWLAELPTAFRHHFTVYRCWSIAYLNHFRMFYQFSDGILAPEAVEGFWALGMPGCAEALAQANAVLGAEFPRDLRERNQLLQFPSDTVIQMLNLHYEQWLDALEREEGVEGFLGLAERYAQQHFPPFFSISAVTYRT